MEGEKESIISLILQMGFLCTTGFLVTCLSFGISLDLRKSLGEGYVRVILLTSTFQCVEDVFAV